MSDGDDEERRQEGADLEPAEGADLGRQPAVGHRLGEDQHRAEIEAGAGQRDDEAVDAGLDDGEAVEPAERRAERQRAEDRDRDRQAEVLEQEAGEHHGADADRADGEVHAAGGEHHHLREADDDVDRERAAEIEEIEGRQESRLAPGEEQPEADDDGEQPDLAGRAAKAEPPPGRRLANCVVAHDQRRPVRPCRREMSGAAEAAPDQASTPGLHPYSQVR